MCVCSQPYTYTCPECVETKRSAEVYVKLGEKEWQIEDQGKTD